jgi:(p)ppGpp synthase/HD superfamily hydrolase
MVAMKNIEEPEPANFLHLTARFTRAIDYARQVHVSYRKGTTVPYVAHLLGVASLVMGESGHVGFPVTEDMVIAALLHDAVEDEGGWPRLRDIEANFGKEVAKIVEGCTDSFEEDSSKKLEWEVRKKSYIDRLRKEPERTLLVSAADKLYNARAILEDYREIGAAIWGRFKRGRKEQLWYFGELSRVFEERGSNRLTEELKRVVCELERVSAGEP